jgi:hypothetical protein
MDAHNGGLDAQNGGLEAQYGALGGSIDQLLQIPIALKKSLIRILIKVKSRIRILI